MGKNLLILTLLLLLSFSGYTQTYGPHYLKQLNNELKISKPDSARVKLLYNLGEYYFIYTEPSKEKGHFDTSIKYFQKALALSQQLQLKNQYNWLNILCELGGVFYFQKDYEKGNAYYMKVVTFYRSKNDLVNVADTYSKWGHAAALVDEFKESLHYYETSRDLYKNLNNKEKEVTAKVDIAKVYFHLFKEDSSKVMYLKLIADNKNSHYKYLVNAYQGLARYYRYKAFFDKALFYAFEANNWMLKTGKNEDADAVLGELAQIYQELGQTDKSIEFYKKTIALRKTMLIRQNYIYRTVGFLIQQLIKKNQPAEGLKYIKDLERDYPPVGNSGKAAIAQAKAYCYDALKQHNIAEKYYKDVIDFYVNNDKEFYNIAVFDICKFYVERKEYKKAAIYLSKTTTDTTFVQRIKDIQLLLYKVDSAKRNYLPALHHLLKYQALNDSIFNATKSKQIEELNIKYETDQRVKDISTLKKDSLLQRERVKQADKIRNLTFSVVVFLIILILLLYYNYLINYKNNIEISKKNKALNQLITEKEWLIKEVHHRVKNNLQIVMGLLQRQSAYINNDQALAAIQNSENRMHSIALIHQKLYQSENLDLICMQEYIDEMITYLKDTIGLDNRILFEKQVDDIYLDVAQAVPLGLILNEAITNAIKYAYKVDESGIIYITLLNKGERNNELIIADNGPGLSLAFDVNKVDSLGINLMMGLSKQLGGTFEITNEDGCIVSITFKTEIFNRYD